MENVFDKSTIDKLDKPLDQRFVSSRTGASNRSLKYIEGHDAIDQANRLFSYGNWGPETLEVWQTVLLDPLTGEAVGIKYSARVRINVRGAEPIIEVGNQTVAAWNVYDQVMSRRESAAKYAKTAPDYDAPITHAERKAACAVIAESHEQAEKGCVTDGEKRGLRILGEQFGNGLYGDGRIRFEDEDDQSQLPTPAEQIKMVAAVAKRAKAIGVTSLDALTAFIAEVLGESKTTGQLTVTDIECLNAELSHREQAKRAA